MSNPLIGSLTGTFTTDATPSPITLSLPSGATEITIRNETDYTAHAASIIEAKGQASSTANTALVFTGSGANPNVITETVLLTAGFTFFSDSAGGSPSAATALTGISQAATAVVSTGDTHTVPLVAGDVVRIYGTTGMLQVAGMDFSVGTIITDTSFQLKYLNSAAFGAAATAGFWRRIPFASGPSVNIGGIAPDPRFYPRRRYITAITAANPAVVTLSVAHAFTVGEKVRLIVPAVFGMTQMNNLIATITAVNYTLNTITLDVDASAFTAFAFPTSAIGAAGITFAQVIPVGEAAVNTVAMPVGNNLNDATLNASINGVIIAPGVLVASKSYSWIAKKSMSI